MAPVRPSPPGDPVIPRYNLRQVRRPPVRIIMEQQGAHREHQENPEVRNHLRHGGHSEDVDVQLEILVPVEQLPPGPSPPRPPSVEYLEQETLEGRRSPTIPAAGAGPAGTSRPTPVVNNNVAPGASRIAGRPGNPQPRYAISYSQAVAASAAVGVCPDPAYHLQVIPGGVRQANQANASPQQDNQQPGPSGGVVALQMPRQMSLKLYINVDIMTKFMVEVVKLAGRNPFHPLDTFQQIPFQPVVAFTSIIFGVTDFVDRWSPEVCTRLFPCSRSITQSGGIFCCPCGRGALTWTTIVNNMKHLPYFKWVDEGNSHARKTVWSIIMARTMLLSLGNDNPGILIKEVGFIVGFWIARLYNLIGIPDECLPEQLTRTKERFMLQFGRVYGEAEIYPLPYPRRSTLRALDRRP